MMTFSYHLPTKIVFGFGALENLGAEVTALKAKRVMIVTDNVMVKTGILDKVTSRLNGTSFDVFDEVEPEPRIEVAESVAVSVRKGGFDGVLGVGGGSVMDMAKVAAAFATNDGPAVSFVGNDLFARRPLPSVMVPTTAGTGAELTVTSMVTLEGHKRWINSPFLFPAVAIVDPDLTMSMPRGVTAGTGLDALCHNTEAYFSNGSNAITDSVALQGIALIVANLERAFDDGADRRAREAMSLGALLGGIALQARMVYGHSIGYTLATRFKLAHGVSCGIPLPYVIANYAIACGPKMSKLAEAYGISPLSDDPVAMGMATAERSRQIVSHMGLPTNMRDLGVTEEEIPALSKECLELYPRPNSPLVFDDRSMAHFYRMIWDGQLG
jgi:alcohol dehydrogenase